MNYGELKQNIIDLFHDNSSQLDDYVPTAVELAERTIFDMADGLNCFKTTTSALELAHTANGLLSIAIGPGADISNTEGLEIVRSIQIRAEDDPAQPTPTFTGSYSIIEERTDEVAEMFARPGHPRYWYVTQRRNTGLTIKIVPVAANTDYQVIIKGFGLVERLDSESNSSTTWISLFAPSALYYATAYHVAVFLKKWEQIPGYQMQMEMALGAVARKEGLQTMTIPDKGVEGNKGGF